MTHPTPTIHQWNPNQPIQSPVKNMVQIDLEKQDTATNYQLLTGSILPRPIAWVSTINQKGIPNLAPFSFFNGVSSNPPCIVFSSSYNRHSEEKDTLHNIQETGEFVVHLVSEWIAEPMHQTSAEYPSDVNEIEKVGLTPIPAVRVQPPRIQESPIHWECKLEKLVPIGPKKPGASTLIIGRVLMMHIFDEAYQDGRIDIHKVKPVSRIGGLSYAKVNDLFTLWKVKAE